MSKFFKYERNDQSGKELVFINISHVAVATFNEQSGNLTIQMEQGQRETVIGDQASRLVAALQESAG